ncbi:MAG: hypothetical protein OEY09_12390 [Gammaproteobacteria bacterium]|nr:hypothetical protein [Gammaproteobacteria bacterium]
MKLRWLGFVALGLGLLINLQACGFQLRGYSSLPDELTNLRLAADKLSTARQRDLQSQLERAGATLRYDDELGPVVLSVGLDTLPERKLVDSTGSNQTILRLTRQLSYSLIDAGGNRLVENQRLVQSQDLELDDNNLLSSEGEKQHTLDKLDDALFNSLMIQLRRL